MKKRKPKSEAWPIRPGDLPARRLLAAEPRLEGIEDNCVFRMGAFRRHLSGWFKSTSGSPGPIVLIVLSLLICGCLGLLLILFFQLYSGTVKGAKRRFFELSSIPEPFLVELNRTTYSPADFALGLWGGAVAARRLRPFRIFLISVTAIFSLLAFAILIWPGGFEVEARSLLVVFIFLLSILSFFLTTPRCAPYHVLPRQARELRRIQRSLQAGGKFGPMLGRFLITGLLLFGLSIGFTLFAVFIQVLSALNFGSDLWSSRLLWLVFALAWPALGIALGLWRAHHVRTNAERYLQRITEDLSYILDWFAHEAAEPPPPGEKL